jgi:hypothetical protein
MKKNYSNEFINLNGMYILGFAELAKFEKKNSIIPDTSQAPIVSSHHIMRASRLDSGFLKTRKLVVSPLNVKESKDSAVNSSRFIYKTFSKSDSTFKSRDFLPFSNHPPINKGNSWGYFIDDNQNPIISYSSPIKHKIDEIPVNTNNNSWLIGFIMLSIIILAFIKVTYEKYFKQYIDSIFNAHLADKMFNDRNVFSRRISMFLTLIYILSIGLFVYEIINFKGIDTFVIPEIFKFLLISFIIYFFYLLIQITTFIWGSIFMCKKEFILYRHNFNLFSKNTGVFLMPIVITVPFVTDSAKNLLIIFGILVIGILYLLRTFRGFQIVVSKRVSFLYLILYLCAFEILPLLILYKIFNVLA